MKSFKNYLKSKHFSPRTISDDLANVERFINWFGTVDQQELTQLTVPKLVEYINLLQKQEITPQVINGRLRSVNKYYDFLKSEGCKVTELENIRVKGTSQKVIIDPLDYSDLEMLYNDYPTYRKSRLEELGKTFINYNQASLTRQIIVGFLVFQGLRSHELKGLEKNHINDENGTIYIAASRRSGSRELKLLANQMRPLFKYLDTLPADQDRLFANDIDNQLFNLLQELRGLNHKVQNATHIRASVILHWLQLHGKRQTQYMIGHKWISSTEYYQLQDLEALRDQLNAYHPLNNVN
jgi:integrase/recombinase XerD